MTPRPELKARVLSAVAREPAPARRAVARRRIGFTLLAAAWATAIVVALGGVGTRVRPASLLAGTAAGWALLALAATRESSRRRSMVGPPSGRLATVVAATPVCLLAWYAASLWRSRIEVVAAPPSCALVCFGATLGIASVPLLLFLWLRRDADPVHPRAAGAAIGVATGAWASVFIDLHCQYMDMAHVALGHVAPAVVLAVLGALAGKAVLGVKAPD